MSQRARLDTYVSGAQDAAVNSAADEWRACQMILVNIGRKIEGAGPEVQESIGGETGPAVAHSFSRASSAMAGQSEEFARGASALDEAAAAIRASRKVDSEIKANPLTPPTVPTRSPGPMTPADVSAQRQYDSDRASYQQGTASQEDAARTSADDMDSSYREVIAVMKGIHGIPDPPPAGGATGGSTGGAGAGAPIRGAGPGAGPGTFVPPNGNGPGAGHPGGGDTVGGNPGGGPGPGGPGGTGPGGVVPPGSGGGILQGGGGTTVGPGSIGPVGSSGSAAGNGTPSGLGGVGAGALLAGGVTGLTSGISGTLAAPVNGTGAGRGPIRGLGGTGRPGGPGTLGRGTGVVPAGGTGTRGTRAGGRGVAGAGASSRSTGRAGGRGTAGAGARGAGAGGGSRGGSKDRRRGAERDLFDDGQDWIDDEDLAPEVLD